MTTPVSAPANGGKDKGAPGQTRTDQDTPANAEPTVTPSAASGVTRADGEDELCEGEHWEYAIRHNQGIRIETSLRSAQQSLPDMVTRYERNHYNTVKPKIIRRRVSDWTDMPEERAR
jgi:hypothetical protein